MKEKIQQMFLMKRPNSEICDVVAKYLIIKYNFKTISGKKTNDIYIYIDEEGIFVEKGKDIIEEECEDVLETATTTHMVNEIRNKIERLTKINRDKMGCNDKNLICLNNGVLNLKTKKLSKHSEKHMFMSKIPINFDKKAHCHEILEFLSQILAEQDIKCIQEWFGYHLYREYFIKKAVIFRGVPDTGKTTFLSLLMKFMGINNVVDKSLQRLAEGKWQIAKLYSKLCNIGDDLTSEDIENTGVVKQLTGRSLIDAEIKFGDSFEFINYAKLNFACNRIPRIKGDVDDEAFWDRWMIFDFDNIFFKEDKDTNPHIIDNITTDKEISGLLNWALEGLKRLQKQEYFSYKRTWEDNKKIMQGEASSVARFNNECLKYLLDNWVSNADFYNKYKEFCELNGITPETNQKFAKDIRKYCNFGKFGVQKGDGKFGVSHIVIKKVMPVMGI